MIDRKGDNNTRVGPPRDMFGFKKARSSVCASLGRIAGITGAMGFALCGGWVRLRPRGYGQS